MHKPIGNPGRRLALAFALLSWPLPASSQSAPSPFFESREPVHIRIEADFDQLRKDRDEENEERPGRAFLTAPDGSRTQVPLQIRTRGRSRLQSRTCAFPPLRLNFPKKALEGTVLEGEDKLKLVTHCRDDDGYEQNVMEEYLAYVAYNVLTDESFRVRLARMTYVQDGKADDTVERWGFLIEDDDRLAERLGGRLTEEAQIHPARFDGARDARVALFHYMIGNTDFSVFMKHNTEVIVASDGALIPVPYDFDASGLVGTPYSTPDPSVGIRSVRQRRYWGVCREGLDYPALYALFLDRRGELEGVFSGAELLGERERKNAVEYLEDFFDTIGSPNKAKREIEDRCRRF